MKTANTKYPYLNATSTKNILFSKTNSLPVSWLFKSWNVLLMLISIMASGLLTINAQPTILWDKTIGTGGEYDGFVNILNTADGGLLWAGTADGIGGDRTATHWGRKDYWVIKTNSEGTKQWDATFGGDHDDVLRYCFPSTDGGFLLVGMSKSQISGNRLARRFYNFNFYWDYWVIKINARGIKEWEKSFTNDEFAGGGVIKSQPSNDGGYWFVWSGCPSSFVGSRFVKINQNGEVVSDNCIGMYILRFKYTSDGHFLVWNQSARRDEDKNKLTKLNENLDVIWSVPFNISWFGSFHETPGNEYLITGGTMGGRGVLTKMNATNGFIWWQRFYSPFPNYGRFNSSLVTGENKLLLLGQLYPRGLEEDERRSQYDYWAAKMDFDGNLEWQKFIGGSDYDGGRKIIKVTDTTYVVAGSSRSPISGDKTENSRGGSDFWALKIKDVPPPVPAPAPAPTITTTTPEGVPALPTPDCQRFGIDDRILGCDWPLFLDDLQFLNFNLKVRFFNDPRTEISSVLFKINGMVMNIDNKAPFLLRKPENLIKHKNQLTFKPGVYDLEISAFSETGAQGKVITKLTGNFHVMKGKSWQNMKVIEQKEDIRIDKDDSLASNSLKIEPILGFNRFDIMTKVLKGENLLLKVYDVKGKELHEVKAENSEQQWSLDTTGWAPGVYVIELQSNLQQARSKKIIIK